MILCSFIKRRKDLSCELIFLVFLLTISHLSYSQIDSVWTVRRDTLKIKRKPVIVQEKVLVYVPVPKKKRKPLPKDNHLYLNVIFNNQIDHRHFYDVQPNAVRYIEKLDATTKDGLFYVGYGMGVGYHTNRFLVCAEALVYTFREKRRELHSDQFYGKSNWYFYFGSRFSLGYRIGQDRFMVYPKIEIGLNVFDHTDGQTVSPLNTDTLASSQNGIVNYGNKFERNILTGGPAIRIAYKVNNYAFYIEPYYNQDFNNSIKSTEPFKMKRIYGGCRLGLMFYFF